MTNIIISFLAGFLLNIMPCVLPILSIKIYDIIKYSQTQQNKNNLKIISLSSIMGIIFVFLIFGIINIVFKETGKIFNFGFHFQNPYFLIVVMLLLFLFLLNLLNFFNIHYSPRIISFMQRKYEASKKINKGIFIENFLTAIFMVLFATPCSIPFIGTVATFSLFNESNTNIIYNFLFMGLGMSSPFILILFFPNLVGFLKNKKNLLKITRAFIIFSLFLTIIWLLYILKTEIGIKALLIIVGFLMLIIIQFKIIKKQIQNLVILTFISFSMIIFPVMIFKEDQALKISNSLWKNNITRYEINQYLEEGKMVFLSITAKWCMICNINNITTFSKFKVVNFLNKENIIATKIDLTQENSNANEFYENTNNIYIPKYILFSKKFPNGCDFSGQLSESKFFNEINKCL